MSSGDLIDLLVDDHRAIESLFVRLSGGGGTPQQRRQVAAAMVAELRRHAEVEERYLYPAAREVLDATTIDRGAEEHERFHRDLAAVSTMDVTDARFDRLVVDLAEAVRQHMVYEEAELFPALRDRCPAEQLTELGERGRR